MLRLSAEQHDWLQAQQRDRLALALARVLKVRWPALAAKLGDRVTAFIDAALLQAARRGLAAPAQAARYVNLWCVWGPAFDDKPGFEWAADILRDEHRPPGVKVQQLVLRSRDELGQRSATGVKPEQFDEADAALEAVAVGPGTAPWIEAPPDLPQPRQVCDMTAFDIALGEQGWRQEYRLALSGGGVLINRTPVTVEPQRYRTDTAPLPGAEVAARQIAALAYPASRGHKAWLHLRCAVDTVCDAQVHPRVAFKSDVGGQVFAGMSARLIKVPLYAAEEFNAPKAPTASAGQAPSSPQGKPGAPVATPVTEGALCREHPPRYVQISACTCGLRRAGAPLGTQEAVLSILPAEQWLAEFRPLPQPTWQWPHQGLREAAPPPLVRLERDGQPLPVDAWQQGFTRLGEAFVNGMDGWHQQLLRDEVLLGPRIEAVPQLLHGLATVTWGAREAVTAEGSRGFLRAQLIARLVACATEVTVAGELRHAGTHCRVRLQSTGRALLEADVLREQPEPALAERLMAVKATWSHPFSVELDAMSHAGLSTVSEVVAGSKPGALVGEAGLRPRPDGQGWQWFFKLALQPCTLSLKVWDPVRGEQSATRTLWPAITLVDWSAG